MIISAETQTEKTEVIPEAKEEKSLVVKNAIGDEIHKYNLKISSDIHPAINEAVKLLIARAAARATTNGRKTVMAHDF